MPNFNMARDFGARSQNPSASVHPLYTLERFQAAPLTRSFFASRENEEKASYKNRAGNRCRQVECWQPYSQNG
jgi:hypothetical protein